MRVKNRAAHLWMSFITFSLVIFCWSHSARTQETSHSSVSKDSSQEETSTASSSATQLPSSEYSGDTKKISADSASSNTSPATAGSNTNDIVPTDPSMIPPPESTPTDNATNAGLPTDPNASSTTETSSEEVSPVNNTESIEKKKYETRVRYNEVRTQVEKEEAVAALRQAADKATTPEGQRQTLKAYYELLFKRMKQVDPSLTNRCEVMQGAYLRRIEQNGLEPTIPLKKKQ